MKDIDLKAWIARSQVSLTGNVDDDLKKERERLEKFEKVRAALKEAEIKVVWKDGSDFKICDKCGQLEK